MKKLRILSIIVFVAAAVSFGMYRNEQINSKDNQAPKITMKKDSIKVSCATFFFRTLLSMISVNCCASCWVEFRF